MRIDIFQAPVDTASIAGAVGAAQDDATGSATPVKADFSWWEADPSALGEMDAEDDVSKWQDAQVEAWSRAA